MVQTLEHIVQSVASVLSRYDVEKAYIFGSYARGEATEESDIDLRLECGSSMTYASLLEIQQQLETALERSVEIVTNPLCYMRPSFRQRVEQDEVEIYAAA